MKTRLIFEYAGSAFQIKQSLIPISETNVPFGSIVIKVEVAQG
jgi:hypothetical protein